MNGKDYFILGCKLFGVYCFVIAIPALLAAIPTFILPQDSNADTRQIIMVTAITMRLLPAIYIIAGVYLIRGGEYLYKFAYPNEADHANLPEEKLLLFVKMLGLFLIIGYFPDLLRTISYYITQKIQPMYNMLMEQQFSYLNAASSLWGVVVGLYLLIGGKFVAQFALKTFPRIQNAK